MKIIAHRGASGTRPENTMAAFRRAWEMGADGIELDVQITNDRQVAVFHDEDGQRIAGVNKRIAGCSWAELSEWDAGSYFDAAYEDERIPSLRDVFAESPDHSLLLIELKCDLDGLSDSLRSELSAHTHKNTALLTFDKEAAECCVRELGGLPVMLNCKPKSMGDVASLTSWAVKHGISGLSMKWSSQLDRAQIDHIKEAGHRTAVWTVNHVEDARRARDMGIEILMTDFPERMIPLASHE